MKQTAVEKLELILLGIISFDSEELRLKYKEAIKNAKEMEKEQQSKFTIDFINWLHLNQYKYNPKAKFYQKNFINETLFFSIDELFLLFKQQEQ
jgi:CO dehydrogenase/acetyl-CoA synthase delta subunit